ncbi:MAG TPA: O-antigen ligase family protein, partial [Flavisolibacter sp.]|nr:O-antigen ligase family protein [Flavisolibacter sp.]
PVLSFFQRTLLVEKLNNWVGIVIIGLVAGVFGYLLANDFIIGAGVLGVIIGIGILLLCMLSVEWGIYINLIFLFICTHISRLFFNDNLPVGIVADVLILATFMGLFVGKYDLKQTSKAFFSKRPVIIYLVVLGYLCLELGNPYGHSVQGWFLIVRKVIESFVIIFICFNVFTDISRINKFLRVLFICALAAGLYGCIQQWHGLFPFEINWVHSSELRLNLIYLFGNYRKFSVFSGPTEFGIIMAGCSLLFILLGINEKKKIYKLILIAGSIIMLLGMSYSGTRTANAMLVGGICLYILLTIHKKSTRIFAVFAVLAFLFIMFAPIYSSETIIRFRTSFSASEDASYNVREANRASIQPYIYSHPIGGGLSTTGENGQKYNPGHQLAGFPTDSSYVNKSLETGWIGMILTCILYFITVQYAVRGYFSTKNPRAKAIFASITAVLFAYYIGEIAQEAVGQFSNTMVYFPVVAILLQLRNQTAIREEEDKPSYHGDQF